MPGVVVCRWGFMRFQHMDCLPEQAYLLCHALKQSQDPGFSVFHALLSAQQRHILPECFYQCYDLFRKHAVHLCSPCVFMGCYQLRTWALQCRWASALSGRRAHAVEPVM